MRVRRGASPSRVGSGRVSSVLIARDSIRCARDLPDAGSPPGARTGGRAAGRTAYPDAVTATPDDAASEARPLAAADGPTRLSAATRVVVLGREPAVPGGQVGAPLVLSSTYHAGGDVVYARAGNPTWSAFEAALGDLEGGDALVFASGMAAVSAALSLLPHGGTVVAPDAAYNALVA